MKMGNKKEKVPSKFNVWLSPEYYSLSNFINLSKENCCCGPTENRTRNRWVTTNYFTIKLLAHNFNHKDNKYLNFAGLLKS